jgi:hypothetical protein
VRFQVGSQHTGAHLTHEGVTEQIRVVRP